MSSNTNFVQLKLSAAATAAQTTLTVTVPSAPFQLPAANGTLTLLDVPAAPTKAEIVNYTTVTNNGNGTATLGGVTRGREGTTAQVWGIGAFLFQSLTAGDYAADLALFLLRAGGVMAGNIELPNNTSLYLGGSKARIFHSGSHAYLENTVGNTHLRNQSIGGSVLIHATDSEGMPYSHATFGTADKGVALNAAGVTRLETNASGVEVTGDLEVSGVVREADTGWLAPSRVNSWAHQGDSPARYRKVGRRVTLTGALTNSSDTRNGTTGFTLPAGFRPIGISRFRTAGGVFFAGTGLVGVNPDGTVYLNDVGATDRACYVGLDGIEFYVD